MGRTKVVGIAGRYGARYGATLRRKVKEILEKRYARHKCPFCTFEGKVIRISTG
ncbi:MAG: 50S ribosomal protein L37ae, partial [Desulfurococcaceae archaeon]